MFDYLYMIGNYDQRQVKRTRTEHFTVDTALCTDRPIPYETAISHDGFRNGEWIILGWRHTKEEAKKFHDEVVEFYKTHTVTEITDVYENKTFRLKVGE